MPRREQRQDRVARPGGNVVVSEPRKPAPPLPEELQKAQLEAAGFTTQMSQATYDRTLSQEAYNRDQTSSTTAATSTVRNGTRNAGRNYY